MSSNSGEAERESKALVCSAGGSHINHLTSLYKSIMLSSAFRRHHALGLHCWKSMRLPRASKALALNPSEIHGYIYCAFRQGNTFLASGTQGYIIADGVTQPTRYSTRKPSTYDKVCKIPACHSSISYGLFSSLPVWEKC